MLRDQNLVNCLKVFLTLQDIGALLKIPPEYLRVIDKDFHGNCRECFKCMLDIWLETIPNASWLLLPEAVESATKLERKGFNKSH